MIKVHDLVLSKRKIAMNQDAKLKSKPNVSTGKLILSTPKKYGTTRDAKNINPRLPQISEMRFNWLEESLIIRSSDETGVYPEYNRSESKNPSS